MMRQHAICQLFRQIFLCAAMVNFTGRPLINRPLKACCANGQCSTKWPPFTGYNIGYLTHIWQIFLGRGQSKFVWNAPYRT